MSNMKRSGCLDCLNDDGSRRPGVTCEFCTGDGVSGQIGERREVLPDNWLKLCKEPKP